MKVDRRGLFRAIVGTGAAFGLALGGCSADNSSDSKDAAAGSGGTSGSGSGGAGSGGANAGSGGASPQDAKVVTDTFRGWATGVPCKA